MNSNKQLKPNAIHEYSVELLKECVELCQQLSPSDYPLIFDFFSVPYQVVDSHSFLIKKCPRCNGNRTIVFSLNRGPQLQWSCNHHCHCEFNRNLIGLIHLFNHDLSPAPDSETSGRFYWV